MSHPIIVVESLPFDQMRYPSAGDYLTDETGCLEVWVASLPDHRYEFLVAIHEIIEATLCRDAGVTDAEIDAFDMQYEADRALGHHSPDSEPGDDPGAPYRRQHLMATAIEKMLAAAMGVDWRAYEEAIGALSCAA